MCEYCGCDQNVYIRELMDQHDRLADLGDSAVRGIRSGNRPAATADLAEFATLLKAHNDLEERGIFAGMMALGEFVELTEELSLEHVELHARLAAFGDTASVDDLETLLTDLADHVEKENRGVFPFAYSAFSGAEWAIVEHGHRQSDHPAG